MASTTSGIICHAVFIMPDEHQLGRGADEPEQQNPEEQPSQR